MVVRIVLVDVAVQERLGGLSRVRVVPRPRGVVLELVGGKGDSHRRPERPGREAGDRSPATVRTKHRAIVEEPPGQVKEIGVDCAWRPPGFQRVASGQPAGSPLTFLGT